MTSKTIGSTLLSSLGLSSNEQSDLRETLNHLVAENNRFTKEGWTKYFEALRIAVDTGVLKQCRYHNGCYFAGNEPIEKAYQVANSEFTAGELNKIFASTQEMKDVIKFVVYDNNQPTCEICASSNPYL